MLTLAVCAAVGQTRSGDDSGVAVRSRVPTTLRYLSQRIAEVDFEQAELDQVMDWIDSLTPMTVVVRWQVLEDAGIERDKPISMRVRNLRLSQVLWLLMEEIGGPDLKLAYRASGELLILSTEEDLGREMVLRVYDVGDLLVRIPRFTDAPAIDFATPQGGGLGRRSSSDRQENGRRDQDAEIEKLIRLIVQTVEPDSWAGNGGLGTIQAFHDLLVVRNNLRVHQALGGHVEGND